jgi:hypothetical protein
MREACVEWAPGMRETEGDRCFEVGPSGAAFVRSNPEPPDELSYYTPEDAAKLTQALDDYATRALCLAELGKRVGIAGGRGLCWSRRHRMWRLTTISDVETGTIPEAARLLVDAYVYDKTLLSPFGFPRLTEAPGIDTDDPLLALALALKATAARGGGEGA